MSLKRSDKYQLAAKNLTVLACTSVSIIPALLTIIIPSDHMRDLAAQMRLQLLYGALTASLLLLTLKSFKDHPRLFAAVVAATLSHIFIVAQAYGKWPLVDQFDQPATRSTLSVMNSNLYIGNRYFDHFTAVVEGTKPDIICLQELTLEWKPTLEKLKAEYPYQALYPTAGYDGTGILSRYPIADQQLLVIHQGSFPMLLARIVTPVKSWTIATVHTSTPMMLERFNNRTLEFRTIAKIASKFPSPAILCGDFNCVPWSQYFIEMEKDSGMKNSGRGSLPELTWNNDLWWFVRIPIDHMLVSKGVAVHEHKRLAPVGSDHFPVFMRISI